MIYKIAALLFIGASVMLTIEAERPDGHMLAALASLALAALCIAEGWRRDNG